MGGLTLGSASPQLVNALSGAEWRVTVGAASAAAVLAAGLMLATKLGPRHTPAPPFRPGLAMLLFRNRGTRLATLGYLGHMWEIYAMWPGSALSRRELCRGGRAVSPGWAAPAAFAVIGVGAVGCVAGGMIADRTGTVRLTI